MAASPSNSDAALGARFLEAGYIVAPAEDSAALAELRTAAAAAAAKFLDLEAPNDPGNFLDRIHERVEPAKLNGLRLAVIDHCLNMANFRDLYFACGRRLVETIVGNELAIQRNIGLSIQLPNDDSSLLPLHSDTWGSECSPFEVVLWIPLVDCRKTKSMWILPPAKDRVWRSRVKDFQSKGIEALYRAAEPDTTWIDVRYGEVLLFTPTLMHGNRANQESTTRWSFNIRFKGLFTPYANKKLGDYFTPLTIRPASRVGIDFEMPEAGDG